MVFQDDADHTSLFLPTVHPAQSLPGILAANKNYVGIIKQSVSTIRDGNYNTAILAILAILAMTFDHVMAFFQPTKFETWAHIPQLQPMCRNLSNHICDNKKVH